MNVRFVTAAVEWGGTEVHTVRLAATLAARGHDVAIVELGRRTYAGRAEIPAAVRVVHVALPVVKTTGAILATVSFYRWWRIFRAMPADVCVFPKGLIDAGTVTMDLAARLCFRRFITIEHLTAPMPPLVRSRHLAGVVSGAGLWWYRRLVARAARALAPHAIICVSAAVRDCLAGRYRFPQGKLHIARNGIDTTRFRRDPERRAELRARWQASENTRVIGAVARLAPVKGLDQAIEAFARLVRLRPDLDVRLVLAGDGPSRDELQAQACALGVAQHVVFTGPTSSPEEIYSALDVFMMPSLNEGLPLALLEAMACGCPAIATAVGGIPEVLSQASLGWLIPAGESDALLGAMRAAVDATPDTLAQMGREARSHVRGNFEAGERFSALADILERSLIQCKGSAPSGRSTSRRRAPNTRAGASSRPRAAR